MTSPEASGATSPSPGGQLQEAITTFSDAVFEATQGLLTESASKAGSRSSDWRGDRFRTISGHAQAEDPSVASGVRGSGGVGAVIAWWSGRCGQGADAGEDLVEQVVSEG